MNPTDLILSLINNARKIIDFVEKFTVNTATENYFLPIQTTGEEVQRISLQNLPVSTPVINYVNNLLGNVAGSKKLTFTVTASTQTTFNVNEPFNSVDVIVDRVIQIDGQDYTVSGTDVIFANAVLQNSIVEIRIHTSSDTAITDRQLFTATAAQTTFGIGHSFETADVSVNRVFQISGTDFNKSGNNIVFVNGLLANDIVQIRTFGT